MTTPLTGRPPRPEMRLTARGVGAIVALYGLLAAVHFVAIWWESRSWDTPPSTEGLVAVILLDYAIKGALTIPVWWILMRSLDGRGLWSFVIAHTLLCPLFVVGWAVLFIVLKYQLFGVPTQSPTIGWYFYLPFMLYVLQAAIFHLVRSSQVERSAVKARALAEAQARSAMLESAIGPHFLFNALTTISAATPPVAFNCRAIIARLGSLLRRNLTAINESRTTLGDELDWAEDYLLLQQARLGKRLRTLRVRADPEARGVPAPVGLLLPLAENAIKHGIEPGNAGGLVRLDASRTPENGARVRIENSLPSVPRTDSTHFGLGLEAVEMRLDAFAGQGSRLEAFRREDRFVVEIELPPTAPQEPERTDGCA